VRVRALSPAALALCPALLKHVGERALRVLCRESGNHWWTTARRCSFLCRISSAARLAVIELPRSVPRGSPGADAEHITPCQVLICRFKKELKHVCLEKACLLWLLVLHYAHGRLHGLRSPFGIETYPSQGGAHVLASGYMACGAHLGLKPITERTTQFLDFQRATWPAEPIWD
jgi:hypothetical protein